MMSSSRQLLREFVQLTLVNEAAASASGLALLQTPGKNNETNYVLYDPQFFLDLVSDAVIDAGGGEGEKEENPKGGFFTTSGKFVNWGKYDNVTKEALSVLLKPDGIKAFMSVVPAKQPCYGAWVVSAVAAVKGFGPLVYDIAMSDKGSLIPDRGSVSSGAEQVWKFYNSSRSDVTKNKLDDFKKPQTPPKEDDCNLHHDDRDYLNYAYSLNSDVNIGGLKSAHERFSSDVAKLLHNFGSKAPDDFINAAVSGLLMTNGDNLFFEKYSAVQQARHGL